MVSTTIARSERETTTEEPTQLAVDDEASSTVLREALRRYRCELMDLDKRELLWDRIVRLRYQLRLA
jgi:hypothetical protein